MPKKVQRRALIEVLEYDDGTVDIVPKYEPEFDANSVAHQFVQSVYIDIHTFFSLKQGVTKNDEASS